MNNTQKKIALIGAGGHSKVCASIAEILGCEVVFFDDAFPKVSACGKWPVIGTKEDLIENKNQFDFAFIAIGNCSIREKLHIELFEQGFNICNLISPTASIHSSVKLGKGILVVGNACINIDSVIADGVIVNTNATIDHDCVLGEFSHICPGVSLAGEVTVGAKTWVGIGSSVIQQINIGSKSLLGAGSVVIDDIGDNVKIAGVPAKVIGNL
jgi:sugar O-acyltransferase (sialic acid O-acetyltransferase NeuD family)